MAPDIRAVLLKLDEFLKTRDEEGRIVCTSKCGVYAFYDYDDEPIYVGQTYEALRTRIRRHLSNQRTDAVANRLTDEAKISRLLNEKVPSPTDEIELPASCSGIIVPDEVLPRLGHADERIARRAGTIANLAQVVRERDVSIGLRQTLVTQAERLQHLARRRYDEVAGATSQEQLVEQTRRKGPEE